MNSSQQKDLSLELIQTFPLYIRPKNKPKNVEIPHKEVIDWLKSLDYTARFEVFMINDYQVTQAILQMTKKALASQAFYFLRSHKESLKPM